MSVLFTLPFNVYRKAVLVKGERRGKSFKKVNFLKKSHLALINRKNILFQKNMEYL